MNSNFDPKTPLVCRQRSVPQPLMHGWKVSNNLGGKSHSRRQTLLCFSPEILSEAVASQVLSALLHQPTRLTFHQHHSVTRSCCCSFIVSLEISKSLPTLFFLSKIVLYILTSLIFHINCRVSFVMYTHAYGGWLASPMQRTWTWANAGRWGGTGEPSMMQSMGSWRAGHDLATKQQYVRMYYCVL